MRKRDRDNPVGIIGLGLMGGAIGRNLVADGWRVVGHDIDAARRGEAEAAGIEIAQGAAKLAERALNILVSLPNPQSLHATVAEIAAAKLPKRILAEMSTFALSDKIEAEQALRAAGHVLLDCPISGTGAQAKVKDLVIYASGERASVAALEPIFAAFSRQAHDLGAFGNGTRMKFVANLLVAIHNVASAEAFVLGIKAGLDPKQIFELISAGAGTSRVFELRGPMMAENRYDGDNVTMRVKTWQKDMTVIGDFARELTCPTPLFSATGPIYAAAMANGHGGDDTASVCAVLEAMAGIRRQ
jgi:3-hydroxyisobutyrate dehydrogenase-like beta-hydroxyacid dehydrogenase